VTRKNNKRSRGGGKSPIHGCREKEAQKGEQVKTVQERFRKQWKKPRKTEKKGLRKRLTMAPTSTANWGVEKEKK